MVVVEVRPVITQRSGVRTLAGRGVEADGGFEEVDESREHGAQPGGGELGGEGVAAGVGKAGDLGGLAAVDLDQGGVGQAFLSDDGECAAALA